jgi:hypothetical protein
MAMVSVKYQSSTHTGSEQEHLMREASSEFTSRDFKILKKVQQNPVNPTHRIRQALIY